MCLVVIVVIVVIVVVVVVLDLVSGGMWLSVVCDGAESEL